MKKKSKRVRKPKDMGDDAGFYAAIDMDKPYRPECFVYVGGNAYGEHQQIHLDRDEVRKLSRYLSQVVKWMDRK